MSSVSCREARVACPSLMVRVASPVLRWRLEQPSWWSSRQHCWGFKCLCFIAVQLNPCRNIKTSTCPLLTWAYHSLTSWKQKKSQMPTALSGNCQCSDFHRVGWNASKLCYSSSFHVAILFTGLKSFQTYSVILKCAKDSFPPPQVVFWHFFFYNQYQMGTCIISADQMVFSLYFDGGLRIALVDLPPVLIPAWELEVVWD